MAFAMPCWSPVCHGGAGVAAWDFLSRAGGSAATIDPAQSVITQDIATCNIGRLRDPVFMVVLATQLDHLRGGRTMMPNAGPRVMRAIGDERGRQPG